MGKMCTSENWFVRQTFKPLCYANHYELSSSFRDILWDKICLKFSLEQHHGKKLICIVKSDIVYDQTHKCTHIHIHMCRQAHTYVDAHSYLYLIFKISIFFSILKKKNVIHALESHCLSIFQFQCNIILWITNCV